MKQKQTFLWIASFPPPFGGPEVLAKELCRVWRKEKVGFYLVDISKPRLSQERGFFSWKNFIWGLRDILKVLAVFILTPKVKRVYFSNFAGSVWAFRRDLWFIIFGVLCRKKMTAHIHLKELRFVYSYLFKWEKKLFQIVVKKVVLIVVNPKARRDALSLRARKVIFLPNGVDSYFFKPYPSKKKFDFLFLSRLQKKKGFDLFIKALRVLKGKLKNKNREIRVALAGEEKLGKYLAKLKKELLPEIKIKYLGVVEGKDKHKLMLKSRFLVFPSLVDACALVVLEALASGLPTISTNEGAVEYYSWGRKEGVIKTKKSVRDLAFKLSFALDLHFKDYRQLSISARQVIKKKKLDIRRMAKRLILLINS